MHSATVDGGQVRWENDAITSSIFLEKKELGVIRKRSGVIEIDIWKMKRLVSRQYKTSERENYPASDHVARPATESLPEYGT